jgi:hypothetical protein
MPLVFITPYKKTYSSEFCSLSTLIGFIFLILAIFIPLFAAFSSEDFWLRLKEYLEQPKVEFSNDYMLYVSTFNDNLNPIGTYFDSSESRLNNMLGQINGNNINSNIISQDENATITKYTYDDDNDGINDRLIIRYETNNNNDIISNKNDFKLLFFLKYRLTKQVKLLMTPMLYIDIPISSGGKEINLNGDIELVQKSPIVSTTITSQIYNKEKPLNVDENLYSPFDMLNLYNEYKELNYTLKYNYEKVEKSAQGKLIINIEMNIPKLQRVFYIQSVFEAIKYAWMQYFYIFLPIYIILYSIYKFIIESNIFYSHVKSDL